MPVRPPKRIYRAGALEAWFQRLTAPWENEFSAEILGRGRSWYRQGCVRELELTEADAIVHARMDERESYVVLEWPDGKLHVRASAGSEDEGRALAVAGLYEIEELVAEEASPLPQNRRRVGSGKELSNGHSDGNGNGHKPGAIQGKPAVPVSAPVVAPAVPAGTATNGNGGKVRQLTLALSVNDTGLACEAFWVNGSTTRHAALGKPAEGTELAGPEREKLIRLASLARRSGFHFQSARGCYMMEEWDRAPAFLRQDLKTWHTHFTVEVDPAVNALTRGLRETELTGRAVAKGKGRLALHWDLRVGDEWLTPEEARRLLRRGPGTTFIAGRGLVRLPSDQAEILNDWHHVLDRRLSGGLPNYMLLSVFAREGGHVQVSPELQAWRDALMRPDWSVDGLPSFLRPYQAQGVKWLRHLCECGCHGLLADEMGLGKTVQVLSLMDIRPSGDRPNLIVCPASVVPVWRREVARFYPGWPVEVLKAGHDFTQERKPCLWLASYTQLRRHKAILDKVEFGYAVLDEAQFIKNPEAKATQACLRLRARHRLALTGTPLENRPLDLWTLFRYLMPGLLGPRKAFEAAWQRNASAQRDHLRKQIGPFVLRRTKREVARELPDKVEMELACPLSDIQRDEYSRLAHEGVGALGQDLAAAARERPLTLLTLLTRLRQACCDPALLPWVNTPPENSGKLTVLAERLEEVLAGGHKVVIFSQFVSLLRRTRALLETRFPGLALWELTGQTFDREKPVEGFQNATGAGVILVSLRAGGTGITLHAADYVFLLDPWWNPAVEEQAIDRVHRLGQDRTVFVYRMIAVGTIEERIQRLKAEKRALFDRVVGDLADLTDFQAFFHSLSELVDLQGEAKAAAEHAECVNHAITPASDHAATEASNENGEFHENLDEPPSFADSPDDQAEPAPVDGESPAPAPAP
jgi:superfamily II DNA or RNA helicase